VTKQGMKYWRMPLATLVLGVAGVVCLGTDVWSQQTTNSSGSSWTDSIKKQFAKLGGSKPKSKAETLSPDDPTSLKNESKATAKTFVAVGRLYAEMGKFAEAEEQYKLALKDQPNCLPALLAYAQLKEQMGQPDGALWFYQQAVKFYPRQASVYNNLGLFFGKQKRYDNAVGALASAIQIAPQNPLYRNNLAIVLVDQGRLPEAFEQLKAVHPEAVAYYNLGYLLNRRGQTQAAMQHFSLAVQADPNMTQAQLWLGYLQKTTGQMPQQAVANSQPPQQQQSQQSPMPPNIPQPAPSRSVATQAGGMLQRAPEPRESESQAIRRLPPVTPQESAPLPPQEYANAPRETAPLPPQDTAPLPPGGNQQLPGISYERREGTVNPSAPLPPETAVRPLPRIN
jgi:tetratricopeptide (TPR) repeat protein